jgi:hypothetical protein
MRTQGDGVLVAFALPDEERVLHIARRVILGKIKGGEIVPVVFDFGPSETV